MYFFGHLGSAIIFNTPPYVKWKLEAKAFKSEICFGFPNMNGFDLEGIHFDLKNVQFLWKVPVRY